VLVAALVAAVALGAGWGILEPTAASASEVRMLDATVHPEQRIAVGSIAHPLRPDWSISITAVGLQAEVDACQWVRMDFSSAVPVPIVAAHNFCGGGIVLEMKVGQLVSLGGTGLDGMYQVVASKDAWADQDATDAISGLTADVILQTCYWEDDGHLILVALHRVG